ncbi:homeobox protein ESX1-like [Talpa occidentalis]|uniref:homeobox protein ESX1-like n=1 Tax=Talpa occidentalis TaxID=50954 RepID=UPI00188F398C|nr:homeobox protein ESX1-like [Talpa occidentalis]
MPRDMSSALAEEDQEEAMPGEAASEGGGDPGAGSPRSRDNRDGDHVLGAGGEDGGPRARRPAFSARQLQALESVFLASPYPTTRLRQQLAGVLNVTERRVQSWFKQRRAKWRRRQRASMMRNVPPMAQGHPVVLNMGGPCSAIYFQHLNCIWPVLGAPPPVVLLPQPPPGHQPAPGPHPPPGPQPPLRRQPPLGPSLLLGPSQRLGPSHLLGPSHRPCRTPTSRPSCLCLLHSFFFHVGSPVPTRPVPCPAVPHPLLTRPGTLPSMGL